MISELLQPRNESFKKLINHFISDYHVVLVAVYELLHKRRKFINDNKFSNKGNEIFERLKIIEECTDGFVIAEADLKNTCEN